MPTSTIFFNAKRRVIMVTNRGKYIAGSTYNPKAKFFRNPDGAVVSTRHANLTTIPAAIRPKIARKVRSNKGVKRGPRKTGSPARNQLAVRLQRYLNGNTANKSILSTPNLTSINRAAKLLKIVAGNGHGWRFKKGSSAGSYKNVSEGTPRRMTRSNILQAMHNYGQGSSNRNINRYVREFREPTPSHLWM